MLTQEEKDKIIDKYKLHDEDTGSPEVQIALLTKKIEKILSHLEEHPKDKSSRKGLLNSVMERKKALNYLKKEDSERYEEIVNKLGL